ncbi:MAG TPA: sugar ABC transporter permease [Propionicimonas sp.]|jgi:raffinose/stachyose/melibiose transport system permease protein|uniref:carbohydrate ABC transporter permease n=1 Tax=Propionicimonas sp. TaxID=1955623 RepID=UPI002F42FC4C
MATSSRAELRPSRLARQRRAAREGRTAATPYLYIAPALVIYAAFLLFPLARAAQFSLFAWDTVSPAKFVGFGNYVKMFSDPDLLGSFGHSAILILFYAVLPIGLGLVVAAILNRAQVRGLGFFRTVIFLPQVIAMVVVAVAWTRLYSTDGSINALLRLVGLGDLARAWLGDYTFALPAVGLIGTWVETGLVTVLLLAGMGRVSRDLYEAARLDGAGPVAEFFAITLPAVRGEIVVAATLTVVAALKNFDIIYMTTRGGPGTSTAVPSYQVYNQAFGLGQVGMATTIGVTLALLIFGINLVLNRLGDKAAED